MVVPDVLEPENKKEEGKVESMEPKPDLQPESGSSQHHSDQSAQHNQHKSPLRLKIRHLNLREVMRVCAPKKQWLSIS